jgi:hypothetical protein
MLNDPEISDMVKREELATEWTSRSKDIYRWHPSLLYGPQHWTISRQIDGEHGWIRHATRSVDCLNLDASLVAYHRTQDRAYVRRVTQNDYYKARDLHQIEPHAPDSPTDILKLGV